VASPSDLVPKATLLQLNPGPSLALDTLLALAAVSPSKTNVTTKPPTLSIDPPLAAAHKPVNLVMIQQDILAMEPAPDNLLAWLAALPLPNTATTDPSSPPTTLFLAEAPNPVNHNTTQQVIDNATSLPVQETFPTFHATVKSLV